MKRAILAFVVSLVIYTMSNFVIHGVLLQPLYQQTPQLVAGLNRLRKNAQMLSS
jgi:hypothetical protein